MALMVNGKCHTCGNGTQFEFYSAMAPICADCVNKEKRDKRVLSAKNKRLFIVRRKHSCRIV